MSGRKHLLCGGYLRLGNLQETEIDQTIGLNYLLEVTGYPRMGGDIVVLGH